jgi:sodium-coupled neutral amino acid transporter 10
MYMLGLIYCVLQAVISALSCKQQLRIGIHLHPLPLSQTLLVPAVFHLHTCLAPASCNLNAITPTQAAYSKDSGYAGYAKADVTQSTVNLVTCVLGAGALGYPFCFKECGLVLATVIMFVTLVATRISYQLLLHCAQLSTRRTYEGIAESALGKGGRTLLEFCIAAMNLGALVAFLDILADVLSAVAGTIIPPGAEPSRHAYITGAAAVGAWHIHFHVHIQQRLHIVTTRHQQSSGVAACCSCWDLV